MYKNPKKNINTVKISFMVFIFFSWKGVFDTELTHYHTKKSLFDALFHTFVYNDFVHEIS